VVEWRGVRILLQVCYDLRFPSFSRNRADAPYDLALYVASWPAVRGEAWSALLKARAIENQCYVAGVNRVGSDPTATYDGRTVLLDPLGSPLAECTRSREDVRVAGIDLQRLADMRRSFPVLYDADR
jgi:predicted amidohydrolase